MNTLSDYFSNEEILYIIDQEPNLRELDDEEMTFLVDVLRHHGCEIETIKNSIYENPHFLMKTAKDLENLLAFLKNLGVDDLDDLFERNPYILNETPETLNIEMLKWSREGMTKEDVIQKIVEGESL